MKNIMKKKQNKTPYIQQSQRPQPTKPVIKPSKKLKAFFWKRVILAEDAPPSALWKQIPEPPINVDEIVELYADNKAPAPG